MDTHTLRRLLRGDDPRAKSAMVAALLEELHSMRLMTLEEACACTYTSGVYALYYVDARHPHYAVLDPDTPVYVGGAEVHIDAPQQPSMAGPAPRQKLSKGDKIANRVRTLASAVRAAASTLRPECCRVRVMPLDVCFTQFAESTLVLHFKPLWNMVVTGIGNHVPGKGRTTQVQSMWDTLHPGRAWAAALPPNPTPAANMWQAVDAVLAKR